LCWTGGASWTVARPRADVVSLEVVALAEGTTRCDAADVIADVARDILLMYGEVEFTVADREDKMEYGRRRSRSLSVVARMTSLTWICDAQPMRALHLTKPRSTDHRLFLHPTLSFTPLPQQTLNLCIFRSQFLARLPFTSRLIRQ
jgi:hypothetical protein